MLVAQLPPRVLVLLILPIILLHQLISLDSSSTDKSLSHQLRHKDTFRLVKRLYGNTIYNPHLLINGDYITSFFCFSYLGIVERRFIV